MYKYICIYMNIYVHCVIIQIVLEVGVKALTIFDGLLVCQSANLSVSWIDNFVSVNGSASKLIRTYMRLHTDTHTRISILSLSFLNAFLWLSASFRLVLSYSLCSFQIIIYVTLFHFVSAWSTLSFSCRAVSSTLLVRMFVCGGVWCLLACRRQSPHLHKYLAKAVKS